MPPPPKPGLPAVTAQPTAVAGATAAGANAGAAAGSPPATLPGPLKAALWLLSAEEDVAVATLAMLAPEEIRRLKRTVDEMQRVGPETLAAVHVEFARLLEDQPLRVRGSADYLGRLARTALGESRAAALLAPRDALPPSAVLMEADVEALAPLLAEEHPQVIAALVATLSPGRAGELVLLLPEALRRNVVTRVARLHKVPQAALNRAQHVISANLPQTAAEDFDVDGVRIAATMLNQLENPVAEDILKNLGTEKLAGEVRMAMFTFEDLTRLDRRGLQAMLKEVANDQLLMALKAASEPLKDKIFASLSKRAADMMREDLQMLGPARLADVEKAQNTVVGVALKLRDEGKITIVGQGGDFV